MLASVSGAILNKAAMKIHVQFFCVDIPTHTKIQLCKYLETWFFLNMIKPCFALWETPKLFSRAAIPFCALKILLLLSLPVFFIVNFLYFSPFNRCYIIVLVCNSLMVNNIEHVLYVYFPTVYLSLWGFLSDLLAIFILDCLSLYC